MMLDLFLGVVIALSKGNASCPSGNNPQDLREYKKYIAPLVEQHQVTAWVSCFKGGRVYWWDSVSKIIHHADEYHAEKALEQLETLVQNKKRLVTIGHSWGGWLQLQMVDRVDIQHYLITVDPISQVDCKPEGPWRGCRHFPSDVDTIRVADETKLWTNFFQTNTRILHSSKAEHANENILVNAGHSEIMKKELVWERLKSYVSL